MLLLYSYCFCCPPWPLTHQPLTWNTLISARHTTHSSTLAWKILWTEEPCRLQSMGSRRVGHVWATFTFHFHALEKEMATYSSILAWRIPGTVEPGGLPSMGSHRVGHDWSTLAAAAAAYHSCPQAIDQLPFLLQRFLLQLPWNFLGLLQQITTGLFSHRSGCWKSMVGPCSPPKAVGKNPWSRLPASVPVSSR